MMRYGKFLYDKLLMILFLTILLFTIQSVIIADTNDNNIKLTKDGVKYIVNPKKIISGGPPKDGIPSIDEPRFVSVKEASKWLKDYELVATVEYKGVVRVYPLQILVWHEIVNDSIMGYPILITYCPLCGSVMAYERIIDHQPVQFGTTGKLYNSNLVMYDRKTDTYWSQIGGLAIYGKLTGKRLKPIPIDIVEWGKWKIEHPDSQVLSRDTGFNMPYGRDPYGNYYNKDYIMFPVEHLDESIFPKTIVYGIEVNGSYKAYMERDLINKSVMYDTIGGIKIKAERFNDGSVRFTNLKSGEAIISERLFWFAWYAFHPGTKLYGR